MNRKILGCSALILASVLAFTGCNSNNKSDEIQKSEVSSNTAISGNLEIDTIEDSKVYGYDTRVTVHYTDGDTETSNSYTRSSSYNRIYVVTRKSFTCIYDVSNAASVEGTVPPKACYSNASLLYFE